MNLPKSSRALVFSGKIGQVELIDLPIPLLCDDEALVRVDNCTLCGSDLHSLHGRREVPIPTILGHEILGTLVHLGDRFPRQDLQGASIAIGDRVVWSIVANCGECFYCLRGLEQKCEKACKYGHMSFDSGFVLSGGLAEYCVLAKGTKVVRLGDQVSASVITPASCATATVMAAMNELPKPTWNESRIAILGAGMLGLTACAVAANRGWKHIDIVDPIAYKTEQAIRFGATQSWSPETWLDMIQSGNQYEYDAVLELSGAQTMMPPAVDSLRIGGHLVLIGAVFPVPPISLLPEKIIRRQLTIRGYHNYGSKHLLEAVRFLTTNADRYPFGELICTWHSLSAVASMMVNGLGTDHVRIGVAP